MKLQGFGYTWEGIESPAHMAVERTPMRARKVTPPQATFGDVHSINYRLFGALPLHYVTVGLLLVCFFLTILIAMTALPLQSQAESGKGRSNSVGALQRDL